MSSNLKVFVLATFILVSPLSATVAQAAPAYSTQTTTVGDLFANPATKAIVEKQFPGIPPEKLNIIDAELAKG